MLRTSSIGSLSALVVAVAFVAGGAAASSDLPKRDSIEDLPHDPQASTRPIFAGAPCARTDFLGAELVRFRDEDGGISTNVTFELRDLSTPCPGQNPDFQLYTFVFRFSPSDPNVEWIELNLRLNGTAVPQRYTYSIQTTNAPWPATGTCYGPDCADVNLENDTISVPTGNNLATPFRDAYFYDYMWNCAGTSELGGGCLGGSPGGAYGDRMPDFPWGTVTFFPQD